MSGSVANKLSAIDLGFGKVRNRDTSDAEALWAMVASLTQGHKVMASGVRAPASLKRMVV